MRTELAALYEHIDDIEIAMMTTRRHDGHLQSRAMGTQKRAETPDVGEMHHIERRGGQV